MFKIFARVILIVGGLFISCTSYAQSKNASAISQDKFPYAFSNFAWWNDAELRVELKKRLPALGDQLERNSSSESKVRTILIQLLKEKTIQAEVQVMEPSTDVLSGKRVPEAPPPSIIYTVLAPPDILVEEVVFENAPEDASTSLNEVGTRMKGKPYTETTFWSDKQKIKDSLEQLGYLTSKVDLDHDLPIKQGDRYLVPIKVKISSGQKYHVASIKADGGPLVQGRDLSPYFALKVGDVATPYAFGRLAGALRSVYWHAGYADVDFSGPPVLDAAHASASYELKVIPGPQYHLGSIKIENLDSAQEAKAREMLGLKSGDIYDAMALSGMSRKLSDPNAPLRGYSLSYTPNEDKQNQVVNLTLHFYRE